MPKSFIIPHRQQKATEGCVDEVEIVELPKNWHSSPAPPELGQIGDRWYSEQCTAVLRVPDAIVPLESNFRINPSHANFRLIEIAGPIDYTVDDRLL
jgi:RES domain-containing protein